MNFDDITIISTLGVGFHGTTYLVKYNNMNYALKIQHILPNDKNKSYKKGLWRELDLYDYINTLHPLQQKFFTKLYGYEIIDDCNHKQKRTFEITDTELLNLDKSKWCVKLLTEYKGKKTLEQYLFNNTLTTNQTYSIILQICNIMLILYDGGYSHNDLHSANIMLNYTEEKTFMFKNKKIPYYGLQISAIDYGLVLHKKFKINYKDYYRKGFLENRKAFLFEELYSKIINVIINWDKYVGDCIKMKDKLPKKFQMYSTFNDGIKIIINEYQDFFIEAKNKYVKLYPKSKELIDSVEKNINKLSIWEIIKNNKNEPFFWKVMHRIIHEFRILHPKLYSKYFSWCSYHKCNLPKQECLDIMLMTNVDELFNYLINKIIKSKCE